MVQKRIGFFECVWQSATNFQFYKDVLVQPVSAAIKYFFILAILMTALVSSKYSYGLMRGIDKLSEWAVKTVPDVQIIDGKAKVGAPQPVKIEDEDSAIILDTSGMTAALDKKYRTGILLGKDNIYVRLNSLKERDFRFTNIEVFTLGCALAVSFVKPDVIDQGFVELSKIKKFVFDKPHIEKWRRKLFLAGAVVFPVFYLIYLLISKLIQAAFFSFVVIFSNQALKYKGITYGNILNLCVYALTPVMILTVGINLLGIAIPYIEFVYLFMYVAFLLGAISQCFPKKRPVDEDGKNEWDDYL